MTRARATAEFAWYRAFRRDADTNRAKATGPRVATPVLYVRGEHETGRIEDYATGLRAAGVENLRVDVVRGAGHFPQQEAPEQTWRILAAFAGLVP
jgi:pimeloyl-ACP methyl ester carboxylesterase